MADKDVLEDASKVAKILENTSASKLTMFWGAVMTVIPVGVGVYIGAENTDHYLYYLAVFSAFGMIIFLIGATMAIIKGKAEGRARELEMRLEAEEKRREQYLEAGADPNKMLDRTRFTLDNDE